MRFCRPSPLRRSRCRRTQVLEIANGIEAVQDGRIFIERVNAPFLAAVCSFEGFRAGIERAIRDSELLIDLIQLVKQ